jgi:hypothetical protein
LGVRWQRVEVGLEQMLELRPLVTSIHPSRNASPTAPTGGHLDLPRFRGGLRAWDQGI